MAIPILLTGAVGMTLEQGGIGAGRVVMSNGINLTIKDRLTHHATAVLTVVESAAASRCFERIQRFYE
jgi:hypothetical protein